MKIKTLLVAVLLVIIMSQNIKAQEGEPTTRLVGRVEDGKWSTSFNIKWSKKEILKQAYISSGYKENTPEILGGNYTNMLYHFKTNGTGQYSKEWAVRALAYEFLCLTISYAKVVKLSKDHPSIDLIADWAAGISKAKNK